MSEANGKKAVLHLDGKEIGLPIYSGTLGPDVIDVSSILKEGHFTFDPGFMATAACESKITSLMVTKVFYYTAVTQLTS